MTINKLQRLEYHCIEDYTECRRYAYACLKALCVAVCCLLGTHS